MTDEESKNVMWVVDKPTKHDLEKFVERLVREGHNRIPFKDGKIILWWQQISVSEGKIFYILTNIDYADVEGSPKFLGLDLDRKLEATNDAKEAQNMSSICLYRNESDPIEYILARIQEMENKKKKKSP